MPGPIVSRPLLRNTLLGVVASLIVAGLITAGRLVVTGDSNFNTVNVTSTLTLAAQNPNAVLYTDSNRSVSTTLDFLFSRTNGLSVADNINTTSSFLVDGGLTMVSATSVTNRQTTVGQSFELKQLQSQAISLNTTDGQSNCSILDPFNCSITIDSAVGEDGFIYLGGGLDRVDFSGATIYSNFIPEIGLNLGSATKEWRQAFVGKVLASTSTGVSAQDPVYSFNGDEDTGFSSSGTSKIAILSGGSKIAELGVTNIEFEPLFTGIGTGGTASFGAGSAQTGANRAGGPLSLFSGAGDGTGKGGALEIRSGDGGASNSAGSVTIVAGAGGPGGGNGVGGDINLSAGPGNGTGIGGGLSFTSGDGGTAENAGNISLNGGISTGAGIGGNIYLEPGFSSVNMVSGFVKLQSEVAGGSAIELRMAEDPDVGTDYVGIRAPDSVTGSTVWSLPSADGAANTVLATNAGTVLSFISVCLTNGTNCPANSDLNWTYNPASDFVRNATATTDIVLGSSATSTGAPVYFDLSGSTIGSSNVYFGYNTTTNVQVSGALMIADGSFSNPSFTFTSDQDTGIAWGGDGIMNFYSNTGHRFRVDSLANSSVSLRPLANDSYDLGTDEISWKDIFASGTVRAVNVSSTRLSVTGLTAAAAGATNPICLDAAGNGFIGASQICPTSALNSKEDIGPISYGLKELLNVDFYDFRFKTDTKTIHSGPVADYLVNTMPNLVEYHDGKINGYDAISMIGVLGQSVKDLNAKVETQQRELDGLNARLAKLENQVGIIEKFMAWLKSFFTK